MKRFIIIAVIAICAISALKQHRRNRETVRHEAHWSWPDTPLTPREHERASSRRSSLRFASARATADNEATAVSSSPTPSASTITSDLKYSEDRALADLRAKIDQHVSTWLAEASIPADWQPPKRLVDALVQGTPEMKLVKTEDYSLFRASVPIGLTSDRKARFVEEYHRHLAGQRLGILGGALAFVLACLGIGVGYVRTDEATKGYYTGRLRLLAAGGVGAAGVLLYQWITRTI